MHLFGRRQLGKIFEAVVTQVSQDLKPIFKLPPQAWVHILFGCLVDQNRNLFLKVGLISFL